MKRTAALLSAAILTFSSVSAANAVAVTPELIMDQGADKVGITEMNKLLFPVRVVHLVNLKRHENGIDEKYDLKMFPRLTKVAGIRAQELTQLRSHTRPDGRDAFTIYNDYSLRWNAVGENIAYGYQTPEDVVEAWMNSKDHRDNILSKNYNYLGVGVAESNGRLYIAQLFLGVEPGYGEAFYPKGYGDINSDGVIDAVDASMVLRDYTSVSSGKGYVLSTSQRGKSDINGDELMDSVDASLMLRIYASNST